MKKQDRYDPNSDPQEEFQKALSDYCRLLARKIAERWLRLHAENENREVKNEEE
ncbi:hypothetical protein Pla110_13740 [Polystyrenella longa]|uniref:Uncharacterized protein n=1 Tax=Polystyrenella longa TaxID=2528007 RepID=A0A518CKA3_9PLAN|nr:hypothetical protein [Polystyrenella longa]QDU79663.1 hypothetical protein Pla110_13740 [Polystyrenella longa]